MKPLPSRPDPSLTERTPQERGRDWEIHTYVRTNPWGGDDTDAQIANYRRWIRENQWIRWDPNPMPRFRLFRWLP